jgi:queuine tRNA-ribosyltransferase
MGVGTPANLLEAVERGVDMFDCIMPTRNGRNGQLFTANGILNMRNAKWANDFSPIDTEGVSFVDSAYSKAYLHHLFKAQEILALQIASIHNLAFYIRLMKETRQRIADGSFTTWKRSVLPSIMTHI